MLNVSIKDQRKPATEQRACHLIVLIVRHVVFLAKFFDGRPQVLARFEIVLLEGLTTLNKIQLNNLRTI